MTAAGLELRVRLPLAHFVLDVDVSSSARSLGVFGPSGAGKTSLVEAVAGWRTPTAGRIRLGDAVLFDDASGIGCPIEQRGVGYVPQDALLLPHWSVGRNIRAGAGRAGVGRSGAAAGATRAGAAAGAARAGAPEPAAAGRAAGAGEAPGLLEPGEEGGLFERTTAMLEIEHLLERPCARLSGGERQRVALARALVSRPRFLLLDEPLGSLDVPLRRRILPYLIRVRDRFGLPTLFVSHDATEVQALCDEVLVLDAGRVRAQGAPGEVLRQARPGGGAFENVLTGVVARVQDGTALVRLDAGGEVSVPAAGLAAEVRTVFAVGADEILVALDPPTRISARNVLPARIEGLEAVPSGEVRVDGRLQGGAGARLSASLTRASADELRLHGGQAVFLVFKTNSCRVLSALGR